MKANCEICEKLYVCWIIQKWESEHKKETSDERKKSMERLANMCGSYAMRAAYLPERK